MNVNKVIIVGRTTRQPELKALPNGSQVCSFSVATGYKYKDKEGKEVEQTEFHNITAFGKVAEVIAKWVVKGQEIYVEGRLKTDVYEKEGQKHYSTKIILEKFQFGSKPKDAVGGENQINKPASESKSDEIEYPTEEINPDDIPF
jgi:single-strand DNA-binding protein